jgi:hypothetical protein
VKSSERLRHTRSWRAKEEEEQKLLMLCHRDEKHMTQEMD